MCTACCSPDGLPYSAGSPALALLAVPETDEEQVRQHATLSVLQPRGGRGGLGNSPWWGIPGGEVTLWGGTFVLAHRVALPSSRGQGEDSALTSPGSP